MFPQHILMKLCLPARDSYNRPMILSGTLIQFGQEQVVFAPKKDHKPIADDHQLIAVTAWKDETTDEHWSEVINNPVNAFGQIFFGGERPRHFTGKLGDFFPSKFQECQKNMKLSLCNFMPPLPKNIHRDCSDIRDSGEHMSHPNAQKEETLKIGE